MNYVDNGHLTDIIRPYFYIKPIFQINMRKTKIKIFGKVQGVFFRQSAKEKAKELNVSCETENMTDGTVEIIVSHPPASSMLRIAKSLRVGETPASPSVHQGGQKINQFIDWCKAGPKYAEVDKVEVVDLIK